MFTNMDADKKKALKNHWELLKLNPNFKALITEAFMQDYLLYASNNYSNPNLRELKGVANPSEIMIGVGCLKEFIKQLES